MRVIFIHTNTVEIWYTPPMNKKTRGFSYIEVIIALALFAIAMLAIIPALTQAGRNMQFAEGAYAGHLQAQRLMLVVRSSLANNRTPDEIRAAAISYAAGDFEFSVWISGGGAQDFHTIDNLDVSVSISAVANNASVIKTIVWGDDGQIAGRAIGMLNP